MLASLLRGELYFGTMQAGDRLDFIRPFDVFVPKGDMSEDERQAQIMAFATIMRQLVFDHPDRATDFQVLEESGFVTVFEASYRLDMPDGSYLHIVGFGHQDDEGLLDAGVSVIEHTDDGVYNGGYVYTLTPDGIRRSRAAKDSDDCDMSDEDRRMHFSVADLYRGRDELEELEQSEDIDQVMAAIALRAELDDSVMMNQLAADMGADDQPPYEGELEQLANLIKDAYYFPLRERAA